MDCKDMAMFSARVLDNKKARDIDVINIGTLADELEEQFQK